MTDKSLAKREKEERLYLDLVAKGCGIDGKHPSHFVITGLGIPAGDLVEIESRFSVSTFCSFAIENEKGVGLCQSTEWAVNI